MIISSSFSPLGVFLFLSFLSSFFPPSLSFDLTLFLFWFSNIPHRLSTFSQLFFLSRFSSFFFFTFPIPDLLFVSFCLWSPEIPFWFFPLGCYQDKGPLAWKKPKLRDIETLYFNSRGRIDWRLNNFRDPIMRCAQAAQAKGFLCFGVQFYGECWGSVTACETYNSYGKSMRCTGGVGVYWANFVYKGRCGSGKYIDNFYTYKCCPEVCQ